MQLCTCLHPASAVPVPDMRLPPPPPCTQAFPSGTTGLFALLFHGGLAAQLALYFLFWTQLNLVQTLPAALALGAFLVVTGYKTLSGLASARIAAASKSE